MCCVAERGLGFTCAEATDADAAAAAAALQSPTATAFCSANITLHEAPAGLRSEAQCEHALTTMRVSDS